MIFKSFVSLLASSDISAPPDISASSDVNISSIDSSQDKRHLKGMFWALTALAVSSCVATGVFGGLTMDANKEYEKSGFQDADLKDKADLNRSTTNVLIASTAALAVAAAIVGIVEIRQKKKRQKLSLSLAAPRGLTFNLKGEF